MAAQLELLPRVLQPADILPPHLAARIRVTPGGHWRFQGCHTSRGRACVSVSGQRVLLYHLTAPAVHGPRPAGAEWSHLCPYRWCCHPACGAWETGPQNRARRWAHEAARRRALLACCLAVALAPVDAPERRAA